MIIQKQIPVSAVQQIFRDDTDLRFICYGIAKILNAEFNLTDDDDRGWRCYAEIDRRFGINKFSDQINRQLWHFLVKLGFQKQHETPYGFDFLTFYAHFNGRNKFNVEFEGDARKFRMQIMEFILATDPDASFTVNLNSKHD